MASLLLRPQVLALVRQVLVVANLKTAKPWLGQLWCSTKSYSKIPVLELTLKSNILLCCSTSLGSLTYHVRLPREV